MKKTLNMTEGNILKLILSFTFPLMISGILQITYNAADMMIVGKFSGDSALAAVGSSGPAINILVTVFLGLSSATSVIVARRIGGGNHKEISSAVHTAMATAIICGIALMISGILLSGIIIDIMSVPENIRALSVTYLRIYFMGIPASLIMSFGNSILQAGGDSFHPTAYAVFSGILNVILNLLFVAGFKMSVAGVALATVISQYAAAFLIIKCLSETPHAFRLNIKKLRITKNEFKELVFLGVPAGLQSSLISVSNAIIQSAVNTCGSIAMAGCTASSNIEGIGYVTLHAFFQTAVVFISQNLGAGNIKRIYKGYGCLLITASTFGLILTGITLLTAPVVLRLYTDSDAVIAVALQKLTIISCSYFLCGFSEVANGALRGLGIVKKAIIIFILFDFGTRIVMRYFGGPFINPEDLNFLFCSFPVACLLTGASQIFIFLKELKKTERNS